MTLREEQSKADVIVISSWCDTVKLSVCLKLSGRSLVKLMDASKVFIVFTCVAVPATRCVFVHMYVGFPVC